MTTFSKQAELDFMHNFRHDTEGDRWAKHEIETLRQQVTLYEQALIASWPEGAKGVAFDFWNAARKLAATKEQ